ncbi:MAG: hypothetical protein ABW032_04495 [Burkholderiaceae bacterium]
MSAPPAWRIVSNPDDLEEGLFGQVLLWIFEILPWLDAHGIQPEWEIYSPLYGKGPGRPVLPGVFDLAYAPASPATRSRSLLWTRVFHTSALGGDWAGTHALWTRYFRVPARIEAQADAVGLPGDCLGLHYRGTDKNRQSIDTNAVSADDFLTLAAAFIARRPDLRAIFVASDEPGLLAKAIDRFPSMDVRGLGDVAFHKAADSRGDPGKADRALLDCVLLSRCRTVLKCSSALSGFAKVLKPELECYRVAACKMFGDIPYFPDAYVPRLTLDDPAAAEILARQFADDWLDDPQARARWLTPFVGRRRYGFGRIGLNALKYGVSVLLGKPRKA